MKQAGARHKTGRGYGGHRVISCGTWYPLCLLPSSCLYYHLSKLGLGGCRSPTGPPIATVLVVLG